MEYSSSPFISSFSEVPFILARSLTGCVLPMGVAGKANIPADRPFTDVLYNVPVTSESSASFSAMLWKAIGMILSWVGIVLPDSLVTSGTDKSTFSPCDFSSLDLIASQFSPGIRKALFIRWWIYLQK